MNHRLALLLAILLGFAWSALSGCDLVEPEELVFSEEAHAIPHLTGPEP